MSELKKTRSRGVRASRAKLHSAMFKAGLKSQAALAELIAQREGLSDAPRQLVSRVMSQRSVDMRTLTRVADALNVQTYCLILSEEDVGQRAAAKVSVHTRAEESNGPSAVRIESAVATPLVVKGPQVVAERASLLVYRWSILLAVLAAVLLGYFLF